MHSVGLFPFNSANQPGGPNQPNTANHLVSPLSPPKLSRGTSPTGTAIHQGVTYMNSVHSVVRWHLRLLEHDSPLERRLQIGAEPDITAPP